ncbi:unnamed protein product [Leuciscus chuanchicus]
MTSRKQLRNKTGDKDGEASNETDDMAPSPEGLAALPEDLERSPVEDGLNGYSDRLVNVKASMDALVKENVSLKEKLDDLENRSRRSNMRVVGIPENRTQPNQRCKSQSDQTQIKHRILRFSKQKRELLFRGHWVFFHEDFSAELGKSVQRSKIKSRLYEKGVRFGLLYPARLRVTHEGKTHLFSTPDEANEFYRSNWGED